METQYVPYRLPPGFIMKPEQKKYETLRPGREFGMIRTEIDIFLSSNSDHECHQECLTYKGLSSLSSDKVLPVRSRQNHESSMLHARLVETSQNGFKDKDG
jgi:hypothetical protein